MNKILIAIVALVIAAGGYWALTGSAPASAPAALEQTAPMAGSIPETPAPPASAPINETSQAAPAAPTSDTSGSAAASAAAGIAMAEIAKHNTQDDCWVVILGKVYDVTAAISQHPGGEKAIINQCGKDGTQAFKSQEKHAQIGALKALAPSLKGDLAL